MTFLVTGTGFTNEFGHIDEPFYNNLTSVLNEMDQILTTEQGPKRYQGIRERVLDLPNMADLIAWGYGDAVQETVAEWEKRFGEE